MAYAKIADAIATWILTEYGDMNRETIERSRQDLERRIEEYIIGECRLFAALHPAHVEHVMVDIRMESHDVTHSTVEVQTDRG